MAHYETIILLSKHQPPRWAKTCTYVSNNSQGNPTCKTFRARGVEKKYYV